tara:strand:- start:133 stop:453 length:321 start_codon:yes stop_codon:yes gene_type:complete
MSYNNSEELIEVSIKIGNSSDWDKILVGRTYYFTVKRNILIKDLKILLKDKFPENLHDEIMKYSIYTKRLHKLDNYNSVSDSFSDINDSYLDIVDKEENIFYALLI